MIENEERGSLHNCFFLFFFRVYNRPFGEEVTYMNIIRYVGLYLLVGFVLHMGWTIIFMSWVRRNVGRENFSEATAYYMGLKIQLYDKYSGLREAKLFIDQICDKGIAGLLLLIVLTLMTWPVAFFEDCVIYSDMVEYVHDVTDKSSDS